MGLCKSKSQLGLFIYLWPLAILIMIALSIVGFPGFNGFIQVSTQFNNKDVAGGVFAIVIAILFLSLAGFSAFLYYKIFRERSILTKALL